MGKFGDLMGKIFGRDEEPNLRVPEMRHGYVPEGGAIPGGGGGGGAQSGGQSGTATASATASQVDVAAKLDAMAASNSEKLDWKHSIVDLMKLVGMDSSLSARKELADELKYTGDKNDSAQMNIWLHKEVMRRLAENGGNVPKELLD